MLWVNAMQLVNQKPIENCFDGSFMKEFIFSEPINRDFINFLAQDCELEYYEFSRPFYRITKPKNYLIKGIEGNTYLRAYFTREHLEQAIEGLVNKVSLY